MKRAHGKKSTERRIKRRRRLDRQTSVTDQGTESMTKKNTEVCQSCNKTLVKNAKALFVEEELGRIFCSEDCIADYFSPEIQRLEKEYYKRLSHNDLSGEERENFAHLRWVTLQEPDEIWREKTLTGDHRFTLISEFHPDQRKIWCVCICLFLRGEPSFLYLAFPTRNAAMVNHYRKGEQVYVGSADQSNDKSDSSVKEKSPTDGLGTEWTEDEIFRAQISYQRSSKDIAPEDFILYENCFNETLENPDEVWSLLPKITIKRKLYHFIRFYTEKDHEYWFIVIAREIEDKDQIEIIDAFPTQDYSLVERFRKGEQEVGTLYSKANSRTIH